MKVDCDTNTATTLAWDPFCITTPHLTWCQVLLIRRFRSLALHYIWFLRFSCSFVPVLWQWLSTLCVKLALAPNICLKQPALLVENTFRMLSKDFVIVRGRYVALLLPVLATPLSLGLACLTCASVHLWCGLTTRRLIMMSSRNVSLRSLLVTAPLAKTNKQESPWLQISQSGC